MSSVSEAVSSALYNTSSQLRFRSESGAPVAEIPVDEVFTDESRSDVGDDARDRVAPDRRRALAMFRQEIRQRQELEFRQFVEQRGNDSPNRLATEFLGSVRAITENSGERRDIIIGRIREAAEQAFARISEIAGDDDAADELGEARELIRRGLDQFEAGALVRTESSLEVDARSRQRSVIRIRTQEGDVVRLDVSRADRLSVSEDVLETGEGISRETAIELSSRSRLSLKVRGDLNEAELTAIRDVFKVAENLAEEFFAGDIEAAFEIAAGLEYDSEQLARVSLRFRNVERISIAQSVLRTTVTGPEGIDDVPVPVLPPVSQSSPNVLETRPEPVLIPPIRVPSLVSPVSRPEPRVTALPSEAESPAPQIETPAAVTVTADPELSSEQVPPASTPVVEQESLESEAVGSAVLLVGFEALAEFLGRLTDFLRETSEQLSEFSQRFTSDARAEYRFTQSLQLEILSSVMRARGPEFNDGLSGDIRRGDAIQRFLESIDSIELPGSEINNYIKNI